MHWVSYRQLFKIVRQSINSISLEIVTRKSSYSVGYFHVFCSLTCLINWGTIISFRFYKPFSPVGWVEAVIAPERTQILLKLFVSPKFMCWDLAFHNVDTEKCDLQTTEFDRRYLGLLETDFWRDNGIPSPLSLLFCFPTRKVNFVSVSTSDSWDEVMKPRGRKSWQKLHQDVWTSK